MPYLGWRSVIIVICEIYQKNGRALFTDQEARRIHLVSTTWMLSSTRFNNVLIVDRRACSCSKFPWTLCCSVRKSSRCLTSLIWTRRRYSGQWLERRAKIHTSWFTKGKADESVVVFAKSRSSSISFAVPSRYFVTISSEMASWNSQHRCLCTRWSMDLPVN